jgi:hypothetical protein
MMSGLLLSPGSPVREALAGLAREARLVFLAGLPGTGKSLLIHQLARLAHAEQRSIWLLQWDVARPLFEQSPAGRTYPAEGGVTHGIVRVAVGLWAREAVVRWSADHPDRTALLIGETPLVGHRLVELARPAADAAEAVLRDPRTRFVIPTPSREVRRHLEAERQRRTSAPLHPREREDAPPDVLHDLWRQLIDAARGLGLVPETAGELPYDPVLYAEVYRSVLRHRRAEVLAVSTLLPAAAMSPYDLGVPSRDLLPGPADVDRYLAEADRRYLSPDALGRELAGWFLTP